MAVIQSEGTLTAIARRPWQIAGFGISPSRGITTYRGRIQSYADLYRTQPNVRLVVRFLGRNLAQLGLTAFEKVAETERIELPGDSELRKWIRRPNSKTTRFRFFRALVEDLALFDVFAAVKMRNPQTGQLQTFRIPPQNIEPMGESWLFPDQFRLFGSTGETILDADAVIWLCGHNPDDPRTGLSSIEALRQILSEDIAAGEWREQFWRKSARISGYISRPKDAGRWSDTARGRFREGWEASFRDDGGRAGETPMLEDGMTYTAAAFSPQEAEYLSARKLTREECAAAYFIPPAFVGILEHANFANMDEQHVSLYADTLGPWLPWITEDLELQLVPEFGVPDSVYLEFNLDEKLRGSFEKQAVAASSSVGAPWQTRNEQRARAGLEPVEGGDELVTPLNVTVGGQASPRDSAPPVESRGDTGAAPPTSTSSSSSSTKRSSSSGAKARAEAMRRELRKWDGPHRAKLEAFVERQSSAVVASLGAGQTVGEAFTSSDPDRWDRELAEDLFSVALAVNEDLGALSADRFGTEYDSSRALAWLETNTRIAAEQINQSTRLEVARAIAGAKAGRSSSKAAIDEIADSFDADVTDLDFEDLSDEVIDTGLPDPLDAPRDAFAARAAFLGAVTAVTRSTVVGNFSLKDGAEQAGARSKVWVVTSSNSRHPELDGETVPIGEDFSNGGAWPGDAAGLDQDQTAGCTCLLDFETA